MKIKKNARSQIFNKKYTVAIDSVPVPEKPEDRIKFVSDQIMPVINQIVTDAMTVAIGTWPTPERPIKK